MDFARMKRRELQALCVEHGLAARGSKADLAASLAGALSAAASAAAAAEKVVQVMAGKGCLKWSGDASTSGSSGAVFNKVTFSFMEKEETEEAHVGAKVTRMSSQQKRIETGSSNEGVAGEICLDAQVMWSRTNVQNLHAGSSIEVNGNLAEEARYVVRDIVDRTQKSHQNPKRIAAGAQVGVSRRSTRKLISSTAVDACVQSQNDPAEIEGEVTGGVGHSVAEEDGKVVRRAVDSKRKQKTVPNAENIATTAHAGISHRNTRKSMSSTAIDTSAQSNNDPAEKEGKVTGGVCLSEVEESGKVVWRAVGSKRKQKTVQNAKNIAGSARAGISRRSTRKSISSTTVDTSAHIQNDPAEKEGEIRGAGDMKLERKSTGKLKVRETLSAATVSGRGFRHMCTERGSNSSIERVVGQVGTHAREMHSKRIVSNLCDDSGIERQKIYDEAEEDGKVMRKAISIKQKRKTRHNDERIAAIAHAGIPRRSSRNSILSDDVLLCPIVEKKRGRGCAELCVDKKSAEVQNLHTAVSPVIIEGKRNQRKEECRRLVVHKSAKVAVSRMVTRSCSVNDAAALPVIIENKNKMKTETMHPDGMAPAVSKSNVHRESGAPATRSLRNRAQNNNTILEETHVAKKLAKKQPRGCAIDNQQFSPVEEEGQAAHAPSKSPPLLENARCEELQYKYQDVAAKRPPVRRSTRSSVVAART